MMFLSACLYVHVFICICVHVVLRLLRCVTGLSVTSMYSYKYYAHICGSFFMCRMAQSSKLATIREEID